MIQTPVGLSVKEGGKQRGLIPFLLLLAVVAAMVPSCKEPELVGIDVLPDDGYGVAWVDTFTLEVMTLTDDSVLTSNTPSSTYLFGEMNDPELGLTRATLYTQFRLPSSNVTFPNQPQIDSVVLNLTYAGSYGNVSKFAGFQRVGVYSLEEDIMDTASYYSNVTHAYAAQPLAQVGFRPNLISNVPAGQDTLPPSLRIRLDPALGQSILNAAPTVLADNDAFTKEFKGLAMVPESPGLAPGEGAILYFNIASANTRLELHYTTQTDTGPTPGRFLLPIDASSATHSTYEHEHPLSITSILNDVDAGRDRAYLQPMAGLRVRVRIPTLRKLRELGHVVINRAELVVPLSDSDISKYGPPLSVIATAADSTGRSQFVIDYFEVSEVEMGGSYRATSRDYVLNMARHIQDQLNKPDTEPDYGMLVLPAGSAVNARRAIINGPGYPDEKRRMKLRLTYTIIE